MPITSDHAVSDADVPVRVAVIGAGSRGNAYARAMTKGGFAIVAAVAEPDAFKRRIFGERYVWSEDSGPEEGQAFETWTALIPWLAAQSTSASMDGQNSTSHGKTNHIDAVFVCTQDETHYEIVLQLLKLNRILHIMCEKPLTTTLDKNLAILKAVEQHPNVVFSVGHVLRYSPHNLTLKKLLVDDRVIGDIVSIEHTEPVGFWHFAHSYVRGNWHREDESAPSLLTKSCHDLDLLLWLMGANGSTSGSPPHFPATVSSAGSLIHFRKRNKPKLAGNATNCLSCPAEPECKFSAKRIYVEQHLKKGRTDWPVKIVVPDIEEVLQRDGYEVAEKKLLTALSQGPDEEHEPGTRFYGQCVYDHDNDVCDDQFVTLRWEDEDEPTGRPAKTASLHMAALSEAICKRRSRIYGSEGEISADSEVIEVSDFNTGEKTVYYPEVPEGGHGGGDEGLARAFVEAVRSVKAGKQTVREAQLAHIGCTIQDIVLSHAMAFAAEEARVGKKVLDFPTWYQEKLT